MFFERVKVKKLIHLSEQMILRDMFIQAEIIKQFILLLRNLSLIDKHLYCIGLSKLSHINGQYRGVFQQNLLIAAIFTYLPFLYSR